jgi:hypothetical protein
MKPDESPTGRYAYSSKLMAKQNIEGEFPVLPSIFAGVRPIFRHLYPA